ncbi:MAG: (2Fe-2S)-binding protein [Micropepsaceae bacterium]|jgi:isoquinoline 1-oxidoreductase alpha subunit
MAVLTVNGTEHDLDVEDDMPLLWALRDELGLTGTKFGCGIAQCGACTVHIDGDAMRSCVITVGAAAGHEITTIEGLSAGDELHPVQEAWIAEDVPQCGYCQTGQIMAAASFLRNHPTPSDDDINQNITNICRCGTYVRVRKAIHRAAEMLRG